MFICNRLQITGRLISSHSFKSKDVETGTPLCVLNEILTAHDYNDVATLDNHKIIVEYLNMEKDILISNDNLSELATYINPDIEWSKSKLLLATKFIQSFYIKNKSRINIINEVLLNFDKYKYQSATNDDPQTLNCCIIYALCRHLNIITYITDSIHDMVVLIKRCLNRNTLFNESLIILSNLDNGQLLSFIRQYKSDDKIEVKSEVKMERSHLIRRRMHINHSNVTHDELSRSYKTMNDAKSLRSRVIPLNNTEAITLAAINYNIDISSTLNPISEYLALKNKLPIIDKHLIAIQQINPSYVMLDRCFNPLFPIEFYGQNIEVIAKRVFNPVGNNRISLYNELSMRYLFDDFYFGLQPEVSNEQSPITLNNLHEVKSCEIICYGARNHTMTFYTFDELISLFNHNKDFRIPILNNISFFSHQAIEKLKIIATKLESQTRDALLSAIKDVENHNRHITAAGYSLKLKYLNGDNQYKINIVQTLTHLLHMSMYMRGWNLSPGKKDFPLVDTTSDPAKQSEIDLNVSREITLFELSDIKIKNIISELPLVKWTSNGIITSNSKDEGLTIGNRIKIIKDGSSVYSCIRLSSNWLASSAHHYMTVIGLSSPFEISKMRFIS